MKGEISMYKAIDIAKYVIKKAISFNRPISNLQLQKILYYIQGILLAKNGEGIFSENIEAWQYGPVIPEVYYAFNKYASSEIINDYDINIQFDEEDKTIIDSIIEEKSRLNAWRLVSDTHKEDPWKNIYKGSNVIIKNEDIKRYFRSIINAESVR